MIKALEKRVAYLEGKYEKDMRKMKEELHRMKGSKKSGNSTLAPKAVKAVKQYVQVSGERNNPARKANTVLYSNLYKTQ